MRSLEKSCLFIHFYAPCWPLRTFVYCWQHCNPKCYTFNVTPNFKPISPMLKRMDKLKQTASDYPKIQRRKQSSQGISSRLTVRGQHRNVFKRERRDEVDGRSCCFRKHWQLLQSALSTRRGAREEQATAMRSQKKKKLQTNGMRSGVGYCKNNFKYMMMLNTDKFCA